jgi:DNA repair protein RadC
MKRKKGKEDWRIASEIELIYKTKVKASERPQITSSVTAYKLTLKSWNPNKIEFLEQFKVLLLNKANRVLGIYKVSTGGITATTLDYCLLQRSK